MLITIPKADGTTETISSSGCCMREQVSDSLYCSTGRTRSSANAVLIVQKLLGVRHTCQGGQYEKVRALSAQFWRAFCVLARVMVYAVLPANVWFDYLPT